MTDIPEVLRDYIQIDDDASIRLSAREGNRRIGMLIIPDIRYMAWKTLFPKDMEKGPQSRYRQSRRVFFAIDDLPANAPTSINTDEATVFFSGFPSSIQAGEWTSNPPTELPIIPYTDITRLIGTQAPKSHPDGSDIPQALKDRNQWLCWKKEERDGKTTKIPVNPKTNTATSAPAAAWRFDDCMFAVSKFNLAGVGISLKDGLIGIDYDHVLDTAGTLKTEYAGLMEEIQALNSYTEVSPSGEGLHVFVICNDIPPECKAGKHTERGEIYQSGRFFTVTGKRWKQSPAEEVNTISAEVYRQVYNRIAGKNLSSSSSTTTTSIAAVSEPVRTDDEVIYLIQKTPKGRALWSGDTSGYPSDSEADAALMTRLADLTGQNKQQMMRVFLKSELGKREKARRPDYIQRTIENACKYVTENTQKAHPMLYDDNEPDEPEDTYDYEAEDAAIKNLMDRAPAPLRSGVDFYNATSPVPQKVFAMHATLISAETVLSRNFQTDPLVFDVAAFPPNLLNDYHAILAPTGCGKEAIKGFLDETLATEFIPIITGASGATAIHLKIQQYPRTILFIDEAGRRISEGNRDPSGIKQSAETYAMEIYGNTGTVHQQAFSDTNQSPKLRSIKRPGLTVIRTSTPETFAEAVPFALVRDGWMPRHNIVVSNRPRPASLGAYHPDGETYDPRELLYDWIDWRNAHIGMPEADTYNQSVNPITACVWGYMIPEEYMRATKDMRNKNMLYRTYQDVWKDYPIPIKWEPEAGEEIGKIYAEIEAVPTDNYTPMRRRKLAHIIRFAGVIAVLRDGITLMDMRKIYQKYAGTELGAELLRIETEKKKALDVATAEYEALKSSKGKSKEIKQMQQEAYTEYIKAAEEFKKAQSQAESKVRMPIRREAGERFSRIRVTVEDVRWAYDYVNFIEIGAKKLIDEEITDVGFKTALDAVVTYLEKHGGTAAESRIYDKCSAIRKIDQKLYYKAFWDYAEDSGRVYSVKTGKKGRRWKLVENPQATGAKEEREHPKKT